MASRSASAPSRRTGRRRWRDDSAIHHCVDGALIVVSWWNISRPRPKAIGSTPRMADSGGQHHWPGALAAGLQHGIHLVPAFLAQAVVGVDQHDVVVHDDAGQRDEADARHDDARRSVPSAAYRARRRSTAMTTQVSTSKTLVNLLNCASRTRKIRKIAAPNALIRKAPASALSSLEPASFQSTPCLAMSPTTLPTCCLHRGDLIAGSRRWPGS